MISLSGIYLKLAHFPVKIGLIEGVEGVPEICFSLESSLIGYLGAHAKFCNPSCLLSGRKATASEEEDHRGYIDDHRGYIDDHRGYIDDHRGYIDDHRGYIDDHRGYIIKYQK